MKSLQTRLKALLLLFVVSTFASFAVSESAEARAGRGRSVGRSSSIFGSRQSPPAGQHATPPASQRGGLMKGLGLGLGAGLLGGMLFGSAAGLGGGGIGMFDILLLAGIAFLGFRWWKQRQMQKQALAYGGSMGGSGMGAARVSNAGILDAKQGWGQQGRDSRPLQASSPVTKSIDTFAAPSSFKALAPDGIDSEEASDIFFKVQGAWTRRDLSSIEALIGPEMRTTLAQDIEDLKATRSINRLENISIRRAEVLQSWQEDGRDFSMVRFTANLLDYTVDESTNRIVAGSESVPVKFEEDWIFSRQLPSAYGQTDSQASGWRLVGIQQPD